MAEFKDYKHQANIASRLASTTGFALFWEQGTGKTRPIIKNMAEQYEEGIIDTLLVVAPMGVHLNWETDELPAHLSPELLKVMKVVSWRPSGSGTKWQLRLLDELLLHQGLAVFCVPVESFRTDFMKKYVWKLLKKRSVYYVLDEGITIKSPGAKRTISIVASAKYAKTRRLLNGTPVANEPWDVFSQMKFIDENFWKPYELDGIEVFKSHFGIWKKISADKSASGAEFDMCVGYRRLAELKTILDTASDRITKEDAGLDIPPKVFTKARFDITPEQQRHYTALKEEFMTWLDTVDRCESCGGTGRMDSGSETTLMCEECGGSGSSTSGLLTADLAITRLLRFQQVTCGYLPTPLGHELDFQMMKENPRLDRLMTGVNNLSSPAIIWYRFRKDGDLIMAELAKSKKKAVRYDGTVAEIDRAAAKAAFQNGEAQFFCANPAAISMGVTLIQAKTVIYYNNDFSYVKRVQSEDRAHRIGQTSSVLYVDLVANGTVDEGIVKALREKMDIASQVTGDKVKSWI